MIKPEDIPQDVWNAALEATGGWMAAGEPESNEALVKSVARAIMAAQAEQREKDARLCERRANSHGWNYHLPSVGRELADAIRRGEA